MLTIFVFFVQVACWSIFFELRFRHLCSAPFHCPVPCTNISCHGFGSNCTKLLKKSKLL